MAIHTALHEVLERLCRTCNIFRCGPFSEVIRGLMSLLIDVFENLKIIAQLMFDRRHNLIRERVALNCPRGLLKSFEVLDQQSGGYLHVLCPELRHDRAQGQFVCFMLSQRESNHY